MKLNKLFTIGLLSMFMLASCDDAKEPVYNPAQESAGLYFPASTPASMDVSKSATSFDLTVDRTGSTEATTYPIDFSCADASYANLFTLPSSVTFAEGAKSATITIGCNLADVPTNSKFVINYSLGESGFEYGITSGTLTINVPAPWNEWVKYDNGLCTWNYDTNFLMNGADPDLPIFIRDNKEDATQAQFKIEHWRQDVPLIINWDRNTNNVRIPFETETGVKITMSGVSYTEYVSDAYSFYLGQGLDPSEYEDVSKFDPEKGLFDIFVVYYIFDSEDGKYYTLTDNSDNSSYGYETCQVGDFKDYSVSLKYEGVFTSVSTESFAQFVTNVGADASEAKIMISNTMSAQDILGAIVAGDESAVSVATGEQSVRVPVSEGGEFIAVLASFGDGEVQNATAIKFNILLGVGPDSDWQDYSTGLIQDGWFTAAFTFTAKDGSEVTYEELPWEFTVQKHKTEPGLYRLKNVYLAPTSVLNELEINENEAPYSIIVDCSNPEVVKIQPQASGFATSRSSFGFSAENNYMGYMGNMAGFAVAQAGWTDEQIIAKGWNDSYLEDGIVVVESCKFGADANENFGYAWNSKPVGMIALEDLSAGAPLKKLDSKLNLRAKAKVAGMLRPIRHNMDLKSAPIVINKKGIDKSMVLKVK